MVDQILQTSILFMVIAWVIRQLSGDAPVDWWKFSVLTFAFGSTCAAITAILIKIWS